MLSLILLPVIQVAGTAVAQYIIESRALAKSKKFDLLEGEKEIKKDSVEWHPRGEMPLAQEFVKGGSINGILCLTNKRLRFQRNKLYISYPLSTIVAVKPGQVRLENGFELEFSDGRKMFLIAILERDDWVAKILEAKNSLDGADTIERAQDGTVLDEDKTTLRRNITNCFNESELRTLYFDLNIDYESVAGSTKEEKARELIVYCEQHGFLIRLLKMCQQQRPHVKWI